MYCYTNCRGKLLFILILLIAANIKIFPQVKINERVEINPLTEAVMPANYATSADLRIEFTGEGGHYGITIGGHTYSCDGNCTIEIPDVPGGLYFESGWGFYDGQSHCYTIKWYYNGFVVNNMSRCDKGAFSYGHINECDDPVNWWTFLRDFDIVRLSVVPQLDHNICEGGDVWDSTSQVTMSLNNTDAEFYNYQTKQFVSSSFSYKYNEGSPSSYSIISKLPYNAQPEEVTLTATLQGIVKNDIWTIHPQSKFTIIEDNFDDFDIAYFKLTPNPDASGADDSMKAHLKVIQGSEYVSFYSYLTSSLVGDDIEIKLADIYNYNYGLQLDNKDLPDTTVPVVVEYELLGNAQIDTVMINPVPLYVKFTPETIAPGDTADIIIKKINSDGTLEDYPPYQTFEIGVLDGCDLGNILVNDSLSNYFDDVSSP